MAGDMTEDEKVARLLRFLRETASTDDSIVEIGDLDATRALSPDEIKQLSDNQREYWGF